MFSLNKKTNAKKIDLVTDLDDLVSKSFAVKFKGKIHEIKPLSVQEFYNLAMALAQLSKIENIENTDPAQLLVTYYELFHSVCDSITMEDVESMEQAQVAAFLATILERFTPKMTEQEKKTH